MPSNDLKESSAFFLSVDIIFIKCFCMESSLTIPFPIKPVAPVTNIFNYDLGFGISDLEFILNLF